MNNCTKINIRSIESGVTVYGFENSTAQSYAEKNDIEFRLHAHKYAEEVIAPVTHFAEGEMECTCYCGDTFTTVIPQGVQGLNFHLT